jgi:hypothetical protein
VDTSALPIPADWDDVTPEWMTSALSARCPGAVVADVALLMRDDGTNRRARFGLTYSAGEGPAQVFAKAEGPAHRLVHQRNGNLFNEAQLYASGVELPLDHPLVYAVGIDRPGLDYVLLMEDVAARGARPRTGSQTLSVDQAANGVRALARLHSRFHGFTAASHPALDWVQTWAPTEGFAVGLRSRIPLAIERAGDEIPPRMAELGADGVVGLWSRFVASLTREPMTLLHADAHLGNVYILPGDDVGFLDWQVVRRGGWSQDVGYFIAGALTVEDRRAHEVDLLREYLGAVGAAAPGWDTAWDRYRASGAYGLAIWLSTLGTDGYQPQSVSLDLARRYATAFTDLETEAALAGAA